MGTLVSNFEASGNIDENVDGATAGSNVQCRFTPRSTEAGPTVQNSHSETMYSSGGARTATATAPDGSYTVSTFQNGQLTNVVHKDSSGSTIGNTGYSYDQHGRQSTMTDARNGTTTYAYNAADQVSTVTTPSPGTPGGSAEVTDDVLQRDVAGDQRSATGTARAFMESDFWPTGELKLAAWVADVSGGLQL